VELARTTTVISGYFTVPAPIGGGFLSWAADVADAGFGSGAFGDGGFGP
jgi:hypothetical protein